MYPRVYQNSGFYGNIYIVLNPEGSRCLDGPLRASAYSVYIVIVTSKRIDSFSLTCKQYHTVRGYYVLNLSI
jgi:hypothetical protein